MNSLHIKTILLTVIVLLVSTHAQADTRFSCVTRNFEKPTLEGFTARVLGRLESDGGLIEYGRTEKVFSNVLNSYYALYQPRDIFCVFGDEVALSEVQGQFATDGGNLFLLAPDGFGDPVLTSGETKDGTTVALALAQAISASRFKKVGAGCDRFLGTNPIDRLDQLDRTNVLTPAGDATSSNSDAYAKCMEDAFAAHETLKGELVAEANRFVAEDAGVVVSHTYGKQVDTPAISDAVSRFLAEIAAREILMEGLYQGSAASTSVIASAGFDQAPKAVASVSQWIAITSNEVLRTATNRSAVRVLENSVGAEIIEQQTPADFRTKTIYRGFFNTSSGSTLEAEFADFLCSFDYAKILELSGNQGFWFNLASFEEMLCGRADADNAAIFYSPASVLLNPNDVIVAGQIGQVGELTLRLERKINELAGIQIDQSGLLNEIRKVAFSESIEAKLERLRSALGAAEEAARAPSVLEQAGTLGELGTDVGKFIGAVGSLVGIWSGIPSAEVAAQGEYLWKERKKLGETGGQFGSSVSGIEKNVQEIKRWFDRTEQVDEVNRLKKAISRLEDVYRDILEDVRNRRVAYRSRLDALSFEVQEIGAALSEIRHSFSYNAADIVALNLLAHTGVEGGKTSMLQCQRAIEQHTGTASDTSLQRLVIGCLQISAQVETRQRCIDKNPRKPGDSTLLKMGSLYAFLAPGKNAHCFQ